MPVDTEHPAYATRKPEWKTIRDAIAGQQAIHEAGIEYLPRLKDQEASEYHDYKRRAVWFNGTGRTALGFQGMLTRKKPQIEAPDLDEIIRDCDLQGSSFEAHCQSVLWELIGPARAGTLIDFSAETNRPFITAYTAEQIINWKVERVAGVMKLTRVVLQETSNQWMPGTGDEMPDKYASPSYTQWREIELITAGNLTTVLWSLWRKKKEGQATVSADNVQHVKVAEGELARRGTRLDFIPFVFHGLEANRTIPARPILLDLANVNIAEYRNSADEENGLHMAGLPTPWAAGFTETNKDTLPLGTTRVWVTEETNAKCGYLEFTGAGLGAIRDAKKEKREMMAALGARILDAPKASAEAAETVRLRQTSESNVLTDLASCAEQSLSDVLRILAWWNGTAASLKDLRDTIFVALNKDLLGARLQGTEITALVQAFQANAISFEAFFHNLQQGNIYPDGHDLEKEKTAIQQNPPPPPLPGNQPPA